MFLELMELLSIAIDTPASAHVCQMSQELVAISVPRITGKSQVAKDVKLVVATKSVLPANSVTR